MDGRWVEVGDRVLVRRYAELDLSVGLVVGDGACLVVDTRGDEGQGAELAAAVRAVTRAPWTVVLTHAHFDHCFGTAAFRPAEVWAHEHCRAALAENAPAQRDHWAADYRARGRPDTADRIAAVRPVLPEHLVGNRATVAIGGRTVVLAHFGPGHTDHDLVVHVPDAGVVFAGDLVEQGAPPDFGDAHPLAWPAALDGILGLVPRVVSPGHGEPVDAPFVAAQRAELAAVAGLARAVVAGRCTPEQAERRSPYPGDVLRTAIARTRATRTEAGR